MSYVSSHESAELTVFRGGLRHVASSSEFLTTGTKNSVHTFHDKMSYERVPNFKYYYFSIYSIINGDFDKYLDNIKQINNGL